MEDDLHLKVALGLIKAPPGFDYSIFHSRARECSASPEADVGRESDCVIVGVHEKDKGSSSSSFDNEGFFEFDGKFGDENINYCPVNDPQKSEADVDDKDVEFIDPKQEDCDVDRKDVESKGLKDEDSDVHTNGVELKHLRKQDIDCDVDTEDVELKDLKNEDCDVGTGVVNLKLKEPKKEDIDGDGKQHVDGDRKQHVDKENLGKSSMKCAAAAIASELEIKLKIGTQFDDLENVYLLYCEYARVKGFSVRKGEQRYFGRTNNIRLKEFICSCAGLPNNRSSMVILPVYEKLVTRTDCRLRLIVSRTDLGAFSVTLFDKEHNHVLVDCDQSFLLRSSRSMSYAKKSVLEALTTAGIGVTKAFNFMAQESGGVDNVGFTVKDAYHHVERCRLETRVDDGDARLLLEYFSEKHEADPFFFCKYQLDDSGRLMNIFFRDNRCYLDYNAFGDVLSVDTTYRTNKYNLICCPFIGINHHTRNVMFGMAMLSDETTSTFKWLFETFLRSMHGKQPQCVFSDQCRAMMNAIDSVFPKAVHRLCQWHISKNSASMFKKMHLSPSINYVFYRCMNIVETEQEFETTWQGMLEKYTKPDKRSWFDGMYNLRERWASCFSRGTFTAGLLATSRSELTNKVLKQVVRCTVALSTFVK